MVENKNELIKFLLKNKIEVRSYYYRDCKYIFNRSKKVKKNVFEENILCLPNHYKVNENYIFMIINLIKNFQNNR